MAKFKWLSRDSSSRLEVFGFSRRVDATRIILSDFSLGSEAWKLTMSNLMTHGFFLGDWNPVLSKDLLDCEKMCS